MKNQQEINQKIYGTKQPNIDHVACTLNVSGTVSVLMGSHSTDHIPIEACVNVGIPKEKRTSQ